MTGLERDSTTGSSAENGGDRADPRTTPVEWLILAVLASAFAPAVLAMAGVWGTVEYASHGYFVPFVALWAASSRWKELRAMPRRRDARGLAGIAAAFGLYLLGVGSGQVALQGLGFVAAAASAVWYLRGIVWLRALAFPLAYLLFMVPVPDALLSPIILQLQLAVSALGVGILRAAGVSLLRTGNVIELPGGESLFVAEACSGITSVITLLPLGVFLAYFTERTLSRRLVLVAAVVPLAMLGNLLRVVGTVLAAGVVGVEAATRGSVHDLAGIATYVLGCLALLAIGRLMRAVAPEVRPPAPGAPRSPA